MSTTNPLTRTLQQLNSSIQDAEARNASDAANEASVQQAQAASVATQSAASAPAAPEASSVVTISPAGAAAAAAPAVTVPVNYTDNIKKSGNINIDALLAGGNAWFHTAGASGEVPSAVARHDLTYSFIDSSAGLNGADANGFQVLDESHKQAVRDALAAISAVANLRFTEVGSGGDIKYGSNVQTASGGYASYPNQGSTVMLANNMSGYANTDPGTYTWEVILHESMHALGLKHPGNYNAGGGGTPGPYLPGAADNRNNTLMSYKDAASMKTITQGQNGQLTKTVINPDTLQANDIMALQYLYGAPVGQEARTFSFDDTPEMARTIWSDNADSIIDLSNQTGTNLVDLRAGNKSSIGIHDAYAGIAGGKAAYTAMKTMVNGKLVTVSSVLGTPTYTGKDNLLIAAGSKINGAVGSSADDTFVTNGAGNTIDGGAGNDRFFLTGGNDLISGGDGDDTVYLKAAPKNSVWTLSEDRTKATLTQTVVDPLTKEATSTVLSEVTLDGIEHVAFWSGTGTGAAIKANATTPLYDEYKGGAGADTLVAKGKANLDGGAGNDQLFIGGSGHVEGGEGDDTVYLKTVAGAVWKFNEDRTQATLEKTVVDTKTKISTTTTLATVTMSGIEHIGFWNGSTAKKTGANAYDGFSMGDGDDTIVAGLKSEISTGNGTNKVFVAGDSNIVGGSGDDTVYLKTVAGATWSFNDDRTVATLIKSVTNATTKEVTTTTLATVNMTGIEHVGYWNGTTAKQAGAMVYDKFTGSAADDTFVASGKSDIAGGDGTNSYYVAGNANITGGSGVDTVYLKATAGATWRLASDKSVAELVKTAKNSSGQMVESILSTINMTGVEHVAFWNGTAAKPLATPAPLAAPVQQAYAPMTLSEARFSVAG